jgi:hypothetical protein
LNTTFGGTILFGPFNTFLYCILGSKVDNLQTALHWLSEHARVTLHTVPENILMLFDESMSELTTPIAAAAVGTSDNEEDQGVVGRLIEHFENALIWERNFYAILLGVWLGLALIGLLVVIWHSGGRDRYQSWRGTDPNEGDEGKDGTRKWPWGRDEHPIYDNYAEKEFRGISPSSGIPQIIEPQSGNSMGRSPGGRGRTSTSFFDYSGKSNWDTARPFVPRKGTFGASISSLVAPGQAFLKMTGRSQSQDNHANHRLVEKGESSEVYNRALNEKEGGNYVDLDAGRETPPPFWVNRFYGGLKSLFPTRGEKHGAALNRNGSQRTDLSFGASRIPSATTPRGDWADHNNNDNADSPVVPHSGHAYWPKTNTDNSHLDPFDDPSASRQYPPHPATNPIYPRPLSRAPTLHEGGVLPRTRVADAPPLPSHKHDRDSVDYLDSPAPADDPYDDVHEEMRYQLASPASSSVEYFAAGPTMESANRVNVQQSASNALAEVISRKKYQDGSARYI